ncbi:MAG: hypothetical protein WCL02_08505 [bacterium]
MNIVQEIMAALLKFTYFNLFQSSLSQREEVLVQNLNKFPQEKNLRIGKSYKNEPVLIWDSDIDHPVACYVTESGFLFSKTEVYKSMNGNMKGSIADYFPGDDEKITIVEKEIEEIKTILMSFSPAVKVYFK